MDLLKVRRSVYCEVQAESSNIIRFNDRNQTSSESHPTCLSVWPWAKQPERDCHSFSYRDVASLHTKVVWRNGGMDPHTLSLGARQGSQLHVPVTLATRKEFGFPTEKGGLVCSNSRSGQFEREKFLAPVRDLTTDHRTVPRLFIVCLMSTLRMCGAASPLLHTSPHTCANFTIIRQHNTFKTPGNVKSKAKFRPRTCHESPDGE
jgi:hypothetical protein